jgi:hypothetical protein
MMGVTALGFGVDIPARIADKLRPMLPHKSQRKYYNSKDGDGHGFDLTITEGKLFIPGCDELPFDFIPIM